MSQPKATFVIVNNLGGVTSLIKNLILFKGDDALPQELIVLDIKDSKTSPASFSEMIGCEIKHFVIDYNDNRYHTYKRLAKFIGNEPGVLISNDGYDLGMAASFDIPKKIVQIVHDTYNVSLSLQYEKLIDAFICHSRFFYDKLLQLLPHRANDIHLKYYGIPLSGLDRKTRLHHDPLKLVFLGRHDKNKGVFDLFEINKMLKEKSIPIQWTILGKGVETGALKQQWSHEDNVVFATPATTDSLYELLSKQDVLVFPTKFEGFPVALVEAMSNGCVPVVTDLPGGISEIVSEKTGHRCEIDNITQFAEAISKLHTDRQKLECMSENAYIMMRNNHDAKKQSKLYQGFFKQVALSDEKIRHHGARIKIGSRLDQKWIPNFVTKTFRKAF